MNDEVENGHSEPEHGPSHEEVFLDDDLGPEGGSTLRNITTVFIVLLAAGGFVVLSWYAYHFNTRERNVNELPVVKADNSPTKEKPEEPGGMVVPNMDKSIYNNFSGDAENLPKVERILPAPEEPVNRADLAGETKAPENKPDNSAEHKAPEAKEEAKAVELSEPHKEEKTEQHASDHAAKTEKLEEAEKPAPHENSEGKADSSAEVAAVTPPMDETAIKPETPAVVPDIAPVVAPVPVPAPAAAQVKEAHKPGLKPISKNDLKPAPKKMREQAPRKAASLSGYKIQLASFKTEKDAIASWNHIKKQHPELVGKLNYYIERKDIAGKGVFYRLQAGMVSSGSDARLLCTKLIEQKQGCFVVK